MNQSLVKVTQISDWIHVLLILVSQERGVTHSSQLYMGLYGFIKAK